MELTNNGDKGADYKIDLYKVRAEEYRNRYENFRNLEWRFLFQVYAGYAAIAGIFTHVNEKFQHHWLVAWLAITATSAFYIATRYLSLRIQERLINFNETHEAYMSALHSLLAVRKLGPSTSSLTHKYYWTYHTQMILSTLILLGLLTYEALSGLPLRLSVAVALLALAFGLTIIDLSILPFREAYRPRRVWYASYGSNLNYEERFMCYIAGGKPKGSQRMNPGCRDKTPPLDNKPIALKFELFFAGPTTSWGGSPAFIRRKDQESIALGRMYLIEDEQFNDVVLQENSKSVDGTRLIPRFKEFIPGREFVLPGGGSYSRLLCISKEDGYPILTFTTTQDDLEIGAPSEAYLKIIISGIKQTYPNMTEAEICNYLLQTDGIRNKIQPEIVTRWVSEAK